MATDGPGLMQGDDGSDFCYTVYNSIDEQGRLCIDVLLKKIKEKEYSNKNEWYRLLAEFIDVARNRSIRKEMWSSYGDEDDAKSYIYHKLNMVVASRKALQDLLTEIKRYLLIYVDPVLAYKNGRSNFSTDSESKLSIAAIFGRTVDDKYIKESEMIASTLEKLSKDEVTTLEQAKSHRKTVMELQSKLRMIGCTQQTDKDLTDLLNCGWFREDAYKDMVSHINSNINNLKQILQQNQEAYFIYRKDDPVTKKRNRSHQKYGLAVVDREANDIIWDFERIPRSDFKNMMLAGEIKPSNMYILNGRLFEMTPNKIVEEYAKVLAKEYCNDWAVYGRDVVGNGRTYDDILKGFTSDFNNRLNNSSILVGNNRTDDEDISRFQYIINGMTDKFKIDIQRALFKNLKEAWGAKNLYIMLATRNPYNNVYQACYKISSSPMSIGPNGYHIFNIIIV